MTLETSGINISDRISYTFSVPVDHSSIHFEVSTTVDYLPADLFKCRHSTLVAKKPRTVEQEHSFMSCSTVYLFINSFKSNISFFGTGDFGNKSVSDFNQNRGFSVIYPSLFNSDNHSRL